MSNQDENKWARRQSTQGNNSASSSPSNQNFSNQPRRSVSRSDRSSSSFQQQNNRNFSNSGGGGGGNNSGGNSGPGGGGGYNSQGGGMVDEHVPVNGFNAKDVKEYLNKAYQDALAAAQGSGENKPTVYKSNDKGWTTPQNKSSPWALNKPTMANNQDFLTTLKKAVAGANANGGGGGGGKNGKVGG